MEVLWDCTNCLTCTTRCPKDIHPADVIIGLRGYIVGEGKGVPPRVRDALMSAFTRGNTLGFATEDREAWVDELDFEVKNVLDEGETDLLFYVGCTPAYDPRIQPVTAHAGDRLSAGGHRLWHDGHGRDVLRQRDQAHRRDRGL